MELARRQKRFYCRQVNMLKAIQGIAFEVWFIPFDAAQSGGLAISHFFLLCFPPLLLRFLPFLFFSRFFLTFPPFCFSAFLFAIRASFIFVIGFPPPGAVSPSKELG